MPILVGILSGEKSQYHGSEVGKCQYGWSEVSQGKRGQVRGDTDSSTVMLLKVWSSDEQRQNHDLGTYQKSKIQQGTTESENPSLRRSLGNSHAHLSWRSTNLESCGSW